VAVRLEHEYVRKGALNLFAAFDTRTGNVTAILCRRKRQDEFIELLEKIDSDTPEWVTAIHLVCDNISIHRGKRVKAWLETRWMNQIEEWFSVMQRKRMRAPNYADLSDLETKITAFVAEWNDIAHPFKWSPKSFDKVLSRETQQAA
jgi:hypothetical protein